MLKSRLNKDKGHVFHPLDSDTDDNNGRQDNHEHSPLHHRMKESRVLGIPNDDEHANDWWMELWDKDDWETKTLAFSGDTKISLVRLHDKDSIQQAAAASMLWDTTKVQREINNGHDRRRARDATTRASVPLREYPKVAWNDTTAPYFLSTWNGNTTTRTHKKDTNDNINISFDTHLNWASTRNPDGVNLCHKAHDQGACGACWAFAATGSLEASAARRIAYSAYQQSVQHATKRNLNAGISNTNNNIGHSLRRRRKGQTKYRKDDDEEIDDETHAKAVTVAQRAEREAIRVANLSVQELVDCDSYGDQGCTGGNPLLAFYFIHTHGLTLSRLYPYAGMEQACRWNLVQAPVATVESWGILTPNHEDNMQRVLRNIGPIAVGVNGAEPAFLSYSGGIFESVECNQQANHALLIVGYGQEQDANGTMVRYWIARNSWGLGWGENGMVRIKRGSGKKGEEGVCGIAKSPSVALGGVLLPASGIASTNVMTDIDNSWKETQERIETSLIYNHCESIGMRNVRLCNRVQGYCESHHVLIYSLFSLTLVGALVVFPLTRDCRKRRRERRHQAEAAERRGRDDHTDMQATDGEMSPLVRLDRQADESYGSGKV